MDPEENARHDIDNGSSAARNKERTEKLEKNQKRDEHMKFFKVVLQGIPSEIAQGILDGNLDKNFQDYDYRTYIHVASDEGNANAVRALLNEGANPNVLDRWARTALDCAMRKNHTAAMSVLKEYGAKEGPFLDNVIFGARDGDLETVSQFILKFPDEAVNYKDHDKRTPLHLACSEGHYEVVKLLLFNHANPLILDRYDQTCIQVARKKGDEKIVKLLEDHIKGKTR